jgi:hypothetical protein
MTSPFSLSCVLFEITKNTEVSRVVVHVLKTIKFRDNSSSQLHEFGGHQGCPTSNNTEAALYPRYLPRPRYGQRDMFPSDTTIKTSAFLIRFKKYIHRGKNLAHEVQRY